ncbi:hypothetical protein CCR75_001577 [Bremia lactucae]|uniref:FH2 domain-containing protein n=1 Tax=Bremia lactucae TaxID=4779 RepID=A0A976FHX1_BRELC|nr:hypothetical protein CCR75_001577 [Bremia lactucae]
MFLAQIRLAAAPKLESQAGILRLIGGDSLTPTRARKDIELQQPKKQMTSRTFDNAKPHRTAIEDTPIVNVDTAVPSVVEDNLARYRTMLKVGVPRPAVERQMLKNGINPAKLNDTVQEGALSAEDINECVPNKVVVATTMRRRWHWHEAMQADRAKPSSNGSVWTQCSKEDAHRRITALSQSRIQELFVRGMIDNSIENDDRDSIVSNASDADIPSIRQHSFRPVKVQKMRVMTGTKGTNLEFVVSRLKIPFAEVAKDVNILTAMYLQETDIKTLLAMWPSIAEQVVLDEYAGNYDLLGRFLVMIRKIPMVKEKLQCLLLKMELSSRAEDLKKMIKMLLLRQLVELVTRALNQICSSAKFSKVVRLLRDFGNLANEEFVMNYKARFSLQSLFSLNHTKAFDKKTTIFDGFLYVLRTEDDGNLADFYDEIPLVMQCKGVSVGGLTAELNQLREGHLLVKHVAQASKNAIDENANLALDAFNQFADEIDDKLRGVQTSFNTMEVSQGKFMSWFEESPSVPLDQHLKAIAQFASDVKERAAILRPAFRRSI